MSNGTEWRGWFSREKLPNKKTKAGVLKGEIERRRLTVEYSSEEPLTLNVAILGFDLVTDVRRGENSGKHLEQQFVVLDHQTLFSKTGSWSLNIPETEITGTERFGLAIWVTKKKGLRPVQAAGNWLEKSQLN
jgi:hypothetical protein